jgi:hypothetical protein
MASVQVGSGVGLLIEAEQRSIAEHLPDQALVLLVTAVAPDNVLGSSSLGDFLHPLLYRL